MMMMMMMIMMITCCVTTAGKALTRTVTLRQAKQPSGTSSLHVVEMTRSQGEPFTIDRQRTTAPWYPQPLYEWKTGRLHDKEQKTFVLSARVQLDSDTGIVQYSHVFLAGLRHSPSPSLPRMDMPMEPCIIVLYNV